MRLVIWCCVLASSVLLFGCKDKPAAQTADPAAAVPAPTAAPAPAAAPAPTAAPVPAPEAAPAAAEAPAAKPFLAAGAQYRTGTATIVSGEGTYTVAVVQQLASMAVPDAIVISWGDVSGRANTSFDITIPKSGDPEAGIGRLNGKFLGGACALTFTQNTPAEIAGSFDCPSLTNMSKMTEKTSAKGTFSAKP